MQEREEAEKVYRIGFKKYNTGENYLRTWIVTLKI
jgi:hypothetical protein